MVAGTLHTNRLIDHPMPHLYQGPTNASVLPSSPLERVATDLYYFLGRKHIIVADYYSRWFDIKEVSDKTSHSVINALTEVFATHGIPDEQIYIKLIMLLTPSAVLSLTPKNCARHTCCPRAQNMRSPLKN